MKCALVTGGSRGIGRAICLKLAQELGYHVLINFQQNETAALETLAAIEAKGGSGSGSS
ncbi:SDR family NAD(P)-dependent oxidoreductase [Sphingobacterium siyangense]|uniref:SDR family NAD(P)-dependent oxidoreductase n=1 Tax=Sphingobacterium siyangense TaxID=459529 RepID=UPI003DA317CE